mgnify:CR=1 FL=1
MKTKLMKIVMLSLSVFLFSSCNEEILQQIIDSEYTAKESLQQVLNVAKNDFAPDAKLAMIYGLNVNQKGEINLKKPTETIFVYAIQSDSKQETALYVPVFGAGPVRSPIGFNDMLGLIKDQTAAQTMGTVFGLLSSVAISASAQYDDSPWAVSKALANTHGAAFVNANPSYKIDLYLIPSKTLSFAGVIDGADWIVNLKSGNQSLVLWINSGTGIVSKISG